MGGRIRILWVVKAIGPGGTETLLLNTARLIDHGRFDVSCAFLSLENQAFADDLAATGVSLVDLSKPEGGLIRRLLRLAMLVRARGWDVVHIHSPLPGSVGRIAARLRLRRRRPAIVTTEHATWGSFRLPTRLLNALTIRGDDVVLAVSQETLDSMSGSIRRRGRVVDQGVPVEVLRHLAVSQGVMVDDVGLPEGPVVISVANFTRHKDHPTLVEALAHLHASGVGVSCVLVGEGPQEPLIRQLVAAAGIGESVRFLGRRLDVPALLSSADLFVLSSHSEGLPVSILESLAIGLPVVASAVGGIPARFGSSGAVELVPPGDVEALASAIGGIIGDAERRGSMREAALGMATEIDMASVVQDLEHCYVGVLRQPGAAG